MVVVQNPLLKKVVEEGMLRNAQRRIFMHGGGFAEGAPKVRGRFYGVLILFTCTMTAMGSRKVRGRFAQRQLLKTMVAMGSRKVRGRRPQAHIPNPQHLKRVSNNNHIRMVHISCSKYR